MPQLPKGNSLDYNPDATVMASKKLSSIALERMKNPIEDPDQNTLSTLQAEKQLNDSFNTLEGMASNFHSLVLRLGGLLGKSQSQSRQKYFPIETAEARQLAIGNGRKKKGGNNGNSNFLNLPIDIVRMVLSRQFGYRRSHVNSLYNLLATNTFSSRPDIRQAIIERIQEIEPFLTPETMSPVTEAPPAPNRRNRDDEDDNPPAPPVQITSLPFGMSSAPTLSARGRKFKLIGGSNGSSSSSTSGSTGSSISVNEYLRNLQHDRRRFRAFYDDDDRNSFARSTVPPSTPRNPSEADYDDAPEPANSRNTSSQGEDIPYYGEPFSPAGIKEYPIYSADQFDVSGERGGATFNSLIFPIINLTRQMNILLISRIKPAISSLSPPQIERLTQIYGEVRTAYNDVVFPDTRRARSKIAPRPDIRHLLPLGIRRATDLEENIIEQNEFGDEILSVWNTELQNLILTLTVIINSWKQNTPTGQQTALNEEAVTSFQNTASRIGLKAELVEAQGERPSETFDYAAVAGLEGSGRKPRGRPKKKSGAMNLIGCGNNFYGENINQSHRDIPTIWSASMRNCPTKYLL